MELVGVRVEIPANTPMLLLRERDGAHRLLPIYIGNPEAASIHSALEGVEPPRPMTHDLMCTVIEDLGQRGTASRSPRFAITRSLPNSC